MRLDDRTYVKPPGIFLAWLRVDCDWPKADAMSVSVGHFKGICLTGTGSLWHSAYCYWCVCNLTTATYPIKKTYVNKPNPYHKAEFSDAVGDQTNGLRRPETRTIVLRLVCTEDICEDWVSLLRIERLRRWFPEGKEKVYFNCKDNSNFHLTLYLP